MGRRTKFLIVAAAVLLLLLFLIVPRMGTFLVVDREPVEADAMVILMGSVPARVLEAADIYHGGYVDRVIMVHSYAEAEELLAERGIDYPGDAELTLMVAVELGIPPEQMTILPGPARSTLDEAREVRAYLEEQVEIGSLLLVTSTFHTRRALSTFEHVLSGLDREVELVIRGGRYDTFQAERWWRDRQSAKMVVYEYLKLAYFYGWERSPSIHRKTEQ